MSILSALAQIGSIFKNKASAKASSNRLTSIAGSFSVGSPMQNGATYSIEIKVDHPAAGAFEYGSGIHATKGTKGKYIIAPKNKNALAFFWDKVDLELNVEENFWVYLLLQEKQYSVM